MKRLCAAAVLLCTPLGLAAAPASTKELVEKGKASFAINCVPCHGATGAGDGPAAAALNPKPRNFKVDPFKNGDTPDGVFKTVSEGIATTPMVAFAHLKDEERWALAYFVLELRGPPAKAAPAAAPKTGAKKK